MDRILWSLRTFNIEEGDIPPWKCPTCKNGIIKIVEKDFRFEQIAETRRYKHEENWEPDWERYRFIAKFKCSNVSCDDMIGAAGIGTHVHWQGQDAEGNHHDGGYHKTYEPKYFVPALHLFEISDKCPLKIREEILNAFGLYWCDYAACANKIRLAVERIMDQQRIIKVQKPPGKTKEKPVLLGRRLELFKLKKPLIADHLIAVKWLGNAGSHTTGLKMDDVLDGFEILEYCIEKLYDDKVERLVRLSKKITRRKGPISKY